MPVGLVATYWGGTPAQAWTSVDALAADPALAHYASTIRSITESLGKLKAEYAAKTLPQWKQKYAEWQEKYGAGYEAALAEFNRIPLDERPSGYLVPFKSKPPVQPRRPGEDPNLPTVLFNGMVHPLLPFGITGVIWYQGESNAGAAK